MGNLAKNQKGFGAVEAVLAFVIIGIIGSTGWYVVKANKNVDKTNAATANNSSSTPSKVTKQTTLSKTKPVALLRGNFGEIGNYGMFQAEGYAKTVKVDDNSNCPMSSPPVACPKIDTIFFVISKVENTKILDYLRSIQIPDTPDKSFQMGCLQDGSINYTNDADEVGSSKAYSINKADSMMLRSASSDKPVKVEITKLKQTYGKAASCYSTFTTYKLFE